jgi:hypothetical protein
MHVPSCDHEICICTHYQIITIEAESLVDSKWIFYGMQSINYQKLIHFT